MSESYIFYTYDCVTGEIVESVLNRREYLIAYYGLESDTTLEDAEAVAAQDEFTPESLPEEPQ